ncbi:MAG TPA: carbohydrate ABC transporter permease, partial [Ruminiclostridium sp.]|nr:carbohydrate ABC transporter permease [Ruminiclostridium sp.]
MINRRKPVRIGDVVFNTFNFIFMLTLVVITLYPFLNTIAISFNNGVDSLRGGIYLWPRQFSLQNYKAIFVGGEVFHAFLVSVERTVLSTVLNIILTTMLAYTISRK